MPVFLKGKDKLKAPSIAPVEGCVVTVEEICDKAREAIMQAVTRHYQKNPNSPWSGMPLADLERTLKGLYASWGIDIKDEFKKSLPDVMKEFMRSAKEAYWKDGVRQAVIGEPDEKRVKYFLDSTFTQVAMRTTKMNFDHVRQLRQLSADVMREVSMTGATRREVSKKMLDRALQIPGFQFIDNAGRKWSNKSYFSMLARTELMNAGRASYDETCAADGYDVMLLTVSGDSCEHCRKWEGRCFSLTGATKGLPTKADLEADGVFHPNCTHSYSAVPDYIWRTQYNPDGSKRDRPVEYTPSDEELQKLKELDKKKPEEDGGDSFPDITELDKLTTVRSLGGSTGARLVEDSHGNRFVMKQGGNAGGDAAGHLRNECAADDFYTAMGVDVPEHKLYETDKGPVKLSRFVDDGRNLGEWWSMATDDERRKMLDKLRPGFDLDVVTGNWDVVGIERDNILIDKDGKPWRIDNGCAFGYRAQGARKDAENWKDGWPDDLWSMRSSTNNKAFFGNIDTLDLCQSITARDFTSALQVLPEEDRAVVMKRLYEIRQLAERGAPFQTDGYTPESIEVVLRSSYDLSKEGLREKMQFDITLGSRNLPTDYGALRTEKNADHTISGEKSFTSQVYDYISRGSVKHEERDIPLDPTFISQCQYSQSSNSYNEAACRMKIVRLHVLGIDYKDAINKGYYMGDFKVEQEDNMREARKYYRERPDMLARDSETYLRYQGGLQLMFENVNLPYADKATRTILLARTENEDVVPSDDAGKECDHRRGVNESHSMFKPVCVEGNVMTVTRVPFSRISGCFLCEKTAGVGDCGFADDSENEITADTRGLRTLNLGRTSPDRSAGNRPYFDKYIEWEKNGYK